MEHQQLAEVTAKATDFDFCAVNADALHEPFEQPHFVACGVGEVAVDVVSVVGGAVRGAQPFAGRCHVAGNHVYSGAVNERVKVGVFGEAFHPPRARGGFPRDFEADFAHGVAGNRSGQPHKHVNVRVTFQPCALRNRAFHPNHGFDAEFLAG